MKVRKQRISLSLQQKADIIRRLTAGENESDLAIEYGVCKRTIHRIDLNKENVTTQINKSKNAYGDNSQKRVTGIDNKPIEKAVLTWFLQKRSLNEPVSGPILQEKAIVLNNMMGGPPDFKASNGWLEKFKKRYGIHALSVQGEKLSSDAAASANFSTRLEEIIEEGGYQLGEIYNADETGLNWKSLPRKTLAAREERAAPGRKESKDRVTVMVCCNADGTHKLPLFVIGKSQKPRCFKNIANLPVVYAGQKSAWMDQKLFMLWYTTVFVPEVSKEMLTKYGELKKVLLLLDNAPSHPALTTLNTVNEMFEVMYLPPNVTALIQPMDQGVIEKTKRLYRGKILRELLVKEDEESVRNFIRSLNMTDCCLKIANAWASLTQQNLRNAWHKLLRNQHTISKVQAENCSQANEILSVLNRVPGFQDCTADQASEWLNTDADCGWQILTDNDIIQRAQDNEENLPSSDIDDDYQSDEEAGHDNSTAIETSAVQALAAISTFQGWFQARWECQPHHAMQLEEMRQITAEIVWESNH